MESWRFFVGLNADILEENVQKFWLKNSMKFKIFIIWSFVYLTSKKHVKLQSNASIINNKTIPKATHTKQFIEFFPLKSSSIQIKILILLHWPFMSLPLHPHTDEHYLKSSRKNSNLPDGLVHEIEIFFILKYLSFGFFLHRPRWLC